MFSRKKALENIEPLGPRGVAVKKGQTLKGQDGPLKTVQGKLKKTGLSQQKRAAFGDLTNATKVKNPVVEGKKKLDVKTTTKQSSIPLKCVKPKGVKKTVHKDATLLSSRDSIADSTSSISSQDSDDQVEQDVLDLKEELVKSPQSSLESERELVAFDKENFEEVFNVGRYAQDIFDYYKRRERMFPITPYMSNKSHNINAGMRSILVDWMVEIQENFELNHETLYLGVKLTDLYLSLMNVEKEALQLVGAAAIFIAAKFDERFPPLIEDFTFVCDNAFDRQEFLEMEMELFRRIGYDLGIPISYRFLRRYAKVSKVTMRTLTLARYILESSLMEYSLITESDSRVAAAALFLAMRMAGEGSWEGDVVKSSGYTLDDIADLVDTLNEMLHASPVPRLSTIRNKYSHSVFHEVAKIPIISSEAIYS